MIEFTVGKPEIKDAVDLREVYRELRHLPAVQEYCNQIAEQVCAATGSENYEVVHAGGPERYRAYVRPANRGGIMEELTESTLLKTVAGMEGQ